MGQGLEVEGLVEGTVREGLGVEGRVGALSLIVIFPETRFHLDLGYIFAFGRGNPLSSLHGHCEGGGRLFLFWES